jgi:hypothetical protein
LEGLFCSWNCALAWGINPGNINNPQARALLRFRIGYMARFCSDVVAGLDPNDERSYEVKVAVRLNALKLANETNNGLDVAFTPAPSPYIMVKFGGSMSPEKYRAMFCTNRRTTEFERVTHGHQISHIRPVGMNYYLENIQMAPVGCAEQRTTAFGWSAPSDPNEPQGFDEQRPIKPLMICHTSAPSKKFDNVFSAPTLRTNWKGDYNSGQFQRQTDRYMAEHKLQTTAAKSQRDKLSFQRRLGVQKK